MDTMKKRLRLEFDVQRIDALKKLNDEFLLVKIYAMAYGKNRNFTYISKEDVIEAIPSGYYCPVIGHIRTYVDKDGNQHSYMGGHDIDIGTDWEIVDITRPYGVIVENSEGWETVNEHGTDVEYLTFNAILWIGRYPELNDAAYSDDILFNQSMEINIKNYRPLEEDSNYYEILGFTFSAFCLLGKADNDSTNGHIDENEHTEPAFINAKVVPYELNIDEFKKEFSLLKDKICHLCLATDTDNATEGGNSMAETTNDVMDTAVTEFEEISAETVDEIETAENAEINQEENTDDNLEADKMNDESVEEDPSEEVAKEEVTQEETAEGATDYETLYNEMKDTLSTIQSEFDEYRESHAYENEAYQALVSYKEQREQEDRERSENTLFSSFEATIGETDEYRELKENSSQYSLDELKMRLYAIVGMYTNMSQPKENKDLVKFSFNSESAPAEEDPYGGAKEYYL